MMEDKLEHDERLRLECLAQSIAAQMALGGRGSQDIVLRAADYERWVRTGDVKR